MEIDRHGDGDREGHRVIEKGHRDGHRDRDRYNMIQLPPILILNPEMH
jgi:hypothetical protein